MGSLLTTRLLRRLTGSDVLSLRSYNVGILQGSAYRALNTRLDTVLAPFEISIPEWKLLGKLVDEDGSKPTELSHFLDVEPPHITKMIDKLAKKKLVQIVPDIEDARAKFIIPTKKGKKYIVDIEPRVRTSLRALFGDVSLPEMAVYIKVLQAIVRNSSQK